MRPRRRIALVVRLLSAPLVAVVVLAGILVAGGLITNDFTLAMWLTVAWMGVAALACVAIAVRSRDFRWPVLGAYAVTAAAAGVYLGMSTLFDKEVNERVATAPPNATADAARSSRGSGGSRATPPRNVRVRAGRFQTVRHQATGTATVIRLGRGGRVLTLTGFEVDNGPDLRVYLVAGPATSEGDVKDFVDLGALKGNKGNQQYELPERIDAGRYTTAVIWCRAFSVLFARAPMRA